MSVMNKYDGKMCIVCFALAMGEVEIDKNKKYPMCEECLKVAQ